MFYRRSRPSALNPCRHGQIPGFTLIELVVVLAIFAVLLGLLLPALAQVREVANRAACNNNLKQIGLALFQYHDTRGQLPSGMSIKPNEVSHAGWLVGLLPYVEQGALAENARLSAPIIPLTDTGPFHMGLRTVVRVFGCPSDARVFSPYSPPFDPEIVRALTSYVGVQGKNRSRTNGVLYFNSAVQLRDITDGTSNTLAVGERPPDLAGLAGNMWPWGMWYTGIGGIGGAFESGGTGSVVLGVREPGDTTHFLDNPCNGKVFQFGPGSINNNQDGYHFWSLHPGGAHFLFADGAVHFLSYSAAPLMEALASRNGGETVALPE